VFDDTPIYVGVRLRDVDDPGAARRRDDEKLGLDVRRDRHPARSSATRTSAR